MGRHELVIKADEIEEKIDVYDKHAYEAAINEFFNKNYDTFRNKNLVRVSVEDDGFTIVYDVSLCPSLTCYNFNYVKCITKEPPVDYQI